MFAGVHGVKPNRLTVPSYQLPMRYGIPFSVKSSVRSDNDLRAVTSLQDPSLCKASAAKLCKNK